MRKCAEKLRVEERWHRELLNRIAEPMQYSVNGGYLQPECLLSGQGIFPMSIVTCVYLLHLESLW